MAPVSGEYVLGIIYYFLLRELHADAFQTTGTPHDLFVIFKLDL